MTKKGFVLLPDKQTEKKIVSLNNDFFPNSSITLNTEQALPHVTVVQTYFTNGFNPAPFLEKFKNIAPLATEPKVTASHFSHDGQFSFIEFREAAWLTTLNRIIIEEVEDWIDTDQAEPSTFANTSEEESWNRTGYKRNLDAYRPHFTIGKEDEEGYRNLPDFSSVNLKRVAFRRLVFCEHNENGAITNILDSIHLPFTWN